MFSTPSQRISFTVFIILFVITFTSGFIFAFAVLFSAGKENLLQEFFAEKVGVTREFISRIERGQENMSILKIFNIANILETENNGNNNKDINNLIDCGDENR